MEEKKRYFISFLAGCGLVMGLVVLLDFFGDSFIVRQIIGPICICGLFASFSAVIVLERGIICIVYQNDGTEKFYVEHYPRIIGFSTGVVLLTLSILIFCTVVYNAISFQGFAINQ